MGKPSQNNKIRKNNRLNIGKKRICKDWFWISNCLPIDKLLCHNLLIQMDERSNQ